MDSCPSPPACPTVPLHERLPLFQGRVVPAGSLHGRGLCLRAGPGRGSLYREESGHPESCLTPVGAPARPGPSRGQVSRTRGWSPRVTTVTAGSGGREKPVFSSGSQGHSEPLLESKQGAAAGAQAERCRPRHPNAHANAPVSAGGESECSCGKGDIQTRDKGPFQRKSQ